MARRQIGQERLALGGAEPRGGTALDEVTALIDWAEVDGLLSGISASAKGEPGWPPLALFRALPGPATAGASPCTATRRMLRPIRRPG
jgi:transposase, IS5 family